MRDIKGQEIRVGDVLVYAHASWLIPAVVREVGEKSLFYWKRGYREVYQTGHIQWKHTQVLIVDPNDLLERRPWIRECLEKELNVR